MAHEAVTESSKAKKKKNATRVIWTSCTFPGIKSRFQTNPASYTVYGKPHPHNQKNHLSTFLSFINKVREGHTVVTSKRVRDYLLDKQKKILVYHLWNPQMSIPEDFKLFREQLTWLPYYFANCITYLTISICLGFPLFNLQFCFVPIYTTLHSQQ